MKEAEFLKQYDPKAYDTPLVSVDNVLFTCHEDTLKVLLVERANHPHKGQWGLPGGFINMKKDKTLEDTARRKLIEKTNVETPYLEQLMTVGGAKRDKRGWAVSICYTALIAHQDCESHVRTVSDTQWHTVERAKQLDLAFDHKAMLDAALERLKQKALYSIVPAYALPEKFTLPELQRVHEIILGKSIEKKSFRRRIEKADLLIDTGEKGASFMRQATLYKIKPDAGEHRFVRNLEN